MSALLSGYLKFTCRFIELPPNTHISSFNDAAQEYFTSVLALYVKLISSSTSPKIFLLSY